MLRFKNVNNISGSPKVWVVPDNGRRIEWRSDRVPYATFYATVADYHTANGFAVPTSEVVEDAMCKQMPRWACVGEGYHTVALDAEAPRTGCRVCGKRR